MCSKLLIAVCLLAYISVATAASASFIKKCKWEDSTCIKESTQAAIPVFAAGIPELGIEKLDPLHYDKLNASSETLILLLEDIVITGVKDCQAKKIQRDVPKEKLIVKALCTVDLNGQYEMNGRLLFLPIQGKGKVHAVLRKVMINVEGDVVEKKGKDGKVHWDIKSWKHTYELKDKASIELENLFQGNEVLGRAARELLDSSANEVIGEVGPPIIKALLTKVIKVVDRFFREVPAEELTLD
ncbi:circadian clock-controlled protein daywake-like [Pectinophora gossypiella]|uniref:Uncharacterized protein n=1 Tax=Pectinophora gossypiella TaxID=13191 RepID=A0A1E1W258_PECGO|nr:circadian clock-controlled protein daywake-like [Pectinophora gossypiella]